MARNNLPFIRCDECEEFSFYMLPKQMFTDERFPGIDAETIVLYSILRDRTTLSIKNDWVDKSGNVYIIYSRESIMEELKWGKNKVINLFRQLREYGLIEEKRQGLGLPNLIYVKSFSKKKAEMLRPKSKFLSIKKSGKNRSAKPCTQKFENKTSCSLENKHLNVLKTNSIYTENNKTNNNDTKIINQGKNKEVKNFKISEIKEPERRIENKEREIIGIDYYENEVKENISYKELIIELGETYVDSLVNVIITEVAKSDKEIKRGRNLSFNKNSKKRLMAIKKEHILYVNDNISRVTSKINNYSTYLLKSLCASVDSINLMSNIKFNTKFGYNPSYNIEEYEAFNIFDDRYIHTSA